MKVIGIAGYSGSGKTTLIEKMIPVLVGEGLRVPLIKHAHHEFDVDQPGKDSYRHRHAGCTEVLVSSSKRWALMHELRGGAEPRLHDQLKHLSPCDLVIVEGYKAEPIAKVEVHRHASRTPLLFPDDPHVVAIATDEPLETEIPQLAGGRRRGHGAIHRAAPEPRPRAIGALGMPMVTLLFFASLRESLGFSREQVALPGGTRPFPRSWSICAGETRAGTRRSRPASRGAWR